MRLARGADPMQLAHGTGAPGRYRCLRDMANSTERVPRTGSRTRSNDKLDSEEAFMKTEMESHRTWAVVASFALGVAGRYFLDPDKGRRRPAIVRGRARCAVAELLDFVNIAAHSLA